MFNIFIPKVIRHKLYEYKQLLLWGCLNRSCQTCKYLEKITDGYYTCKREELMEYLLPDYKNQVNKIEDEIFKSRYKIKR